MAVEIRHPNITRSALLGWPPGVTIQSKSRAALADSRVRLSPHSHIQTYSPTKLGNSGPVSGFNSI